MSKKDVALPDVHKEWATLKDKPIVNENQIFEWMNHLTDDEIAEWESSVEGNLMTAQIDTHILYTLTKDVTDE